MASITGLGAVLALAVSFKVVGADSPETRQVKDQLTRQVKRIRSLDVVYHLETKSELNPEQLRTLTDFRNLIFLPKDDWREAYKGTKTYRRHLQPERVDRLRPADKFGMTPPDEVDPKAPESVQQNQRKLKEQYDRAVAPLEAQVARGGPATRTDPSIRDRSERDVTRAFNGRSLWMRRRVNEKTDEYQVWPTHHRASWFQPSAYRSATGLHVAETTLEAIPGPPIQGMFQLETWLKERPYELEEKTEVIDGSTCVILKGSLNTLFQRALLAGDVTDRVWLDRDHGLAVKKRELARNGDLLSRWENSRFREVEPGIWLPMRCRHDQFAFDAPAELKGKPALSEEIVVESLAINQVPDERFDMVAKQGDRIEDLRGKP